MATRRGRPQRVTGEGSTERVFFYLTPSELDSLKRMASENNQSIGAVARDAVNEFVTDYGDRPIFNTRKPSARAI